MLVIRRAAAFSFIFFHFMPSSSQPSIFAAAALFMLMGQQASATSCRLSQMPPPFLSASFHFRLSFLYNTLRNVWRRYLQLISC
jgi:hypothetical protein